MHQNPDLCKPAMHIQFVGLSMAAKRYEMITLIGEWTAEWHLKDESVQHTVLWLINKEK